MKTAKKEKEPPKYPEIGMRLTQFIADSGQPNARQFALRAGLTPQLVSHLAAGNSIPSGETLMALATAYRDFDSDWLLTGRAKNSAAVPHTRAHGEARTTSHPTVQPADKELTGGTATGPYMHDADPVVQQLLIRLAEKDRIIERQQEDIDAWRDAFRKPLASAPAATPGAATPISLRPSACVDAKIIPLHPVEVETEEEVLAA